MKFIHKRSICIIDDQEDEIRRFREVLKDRYDIGAGPTVDSALEDLWSGSNRRRPDVFLVDMYHSAAPLTAQVIGAINEARMHRLRAEHKFQLVLERYGQRKDVGFGTVDEIRQRYRIRRIPVAFFTRKGTLDNAREAYELRRACPVISKPDPLIGTVAVRDGASLSGLYDDAFQKQKLLVTAQIDRVIRRFSFWDRYGEFLTGVIVGVMSSLMASIMLKLAYSILH